MISKEKDLKNENRDQDRKAEAAALMPEQLVLLAADAEKLASALGMSYQGEKIGGRFRDVLLEQEERRRRIFGIICGTAFGSSSGKKTAP